MKKSTFLTVVILYFTICVNAQTDNLHQPGRQKWLLSFTLGGDLLFFNNKSSPLLVIDKQNNLNVMAEGLGQIEVMYIHNRLAIMSGFGVISQNYGFSNNTWFINLSTGQSNSGAFHELSYTHRYFSIPLGAGLVISPQHATNRTTLLYCQVVGGFRQATKTEVTYFSGTSAARIGATETFLETQPHQKFSQRIAFGIGYRWNIKGSGIGISLNLRAVKVLTTVDSEFVSHPFGVGVHLGLLHQFK